MQKNNTINKDTFLGRLGKDPELNYAQLKTKEKPVPVCNLSVAINHKQGEQEITEWIKVKVWERQAELCKAQLKKGSQIFVNGKLDKKQFTNKEGKKISYSEVNNGMDTLPLKPAFLRMLE